jgi:predicted dehydrogenase
MTDSPLRIAVVGCGNVSRGHIRGWLGDPGRARVVALVDLSRSQAEARRDQFGLRDASLLDDYRDALARPDVDAIDVCTPGHLHTEMIVAALEAGKHVLTEKPTGYTLEECRRLRWHARRYPHLRVGVGYSLRYYPLNIRVRQLLREGAVGDILSVEAAHNHPSHLGGAAASDADDYAPTAPDHSRSLSDSGGHYLPSSELTSSTHVFDFIRYVGGDVRDVFAFRERGGTIALMRFNSGAIGKATAGTASSDGLATPHVLSVQGTKGTLFTQNNRVTTAWGDGYHGFVVTGGKQVPIEVAETDTGHGDSNRTRNFLDAVFHDAPLISSLEDSVATSELLHAIWLSHNLEIRVPVHQAHKTG